MYVFRVYVNFKLTFPKRFKFRAQLCVTTRPRCRISQLFSEFTVAKTAMAKMLSINYVVKDVKEHLVNLGNLTIAFCQGYKTIFLCILIC